MMAIRALLFWSPFAVYFAWRALRRRSGHAVGPAPWAWLFAAGCMVAAVTLIGAASFHGGGTGQYVPAQARPDGSVVPGHFVERRSSRS